MEKDKLKAVICSMLFILTAILELIYGWGLYGIMMAELLGFGYYSRGALSKLNKRKE